MSEGNAARPVRVARVVRTRPPVPEAPPPPASAGPGGPETDRPHVSRRTNRGASRRAVRLSILYAVGLAAVYVFLLALARSQPASASAGSAEYLSFVTLLAVALGAVGVVFALGGAPRWVEIGDTETVVLGRFGHRYRFPGRSRLRPIVLERIPAGLLSPVPLESVEIRGGSTRRSFLLDEGLLEPADPAVGTEGPGPA